MRFFQTKLNCKWLDCQEFYSFPGTNESVSLLIRDRNQKCVIRHISKLYPTAVTEHEKLGYMK